MNKELLIILYKLNVEGMSRDSVEEYFSNFIDEYSLKNDIELKDKYIIREIYLPVEGQSSNVKVIYPVKSHKNDYNLSELITSVSDEVEQSTSEKLKNDWNQLLREIKIRNLS